MNKTKWMGVALGMALFCMATAARADVVAPDSLGVLAYTPAITSYGTYTLNIYRAGSNHPGMALDQTGDFYAYDGGHSVIQWSFNVQIAGRVTLGIIAEGIDPLENDEVFMNDQSLGYLIPQASPSTSNKLGYHDAIAGGNSRTESIFNLGPLNTDTYTFTIMVEAGVNGTAWVNEIEKSYLIVSDPNPPSQVPVPSTGLLLGTALTGCTALARKRLF